MTKETKKQIKNKDIETHPKAQKDRVTVTKEICEQIFEMMIVEGKSVREITRDPMFPTWGSFLRAVFKDPDLKKQYDAAMQIRAMKYEEEIIDIADNGTNDWMETNNPDNEGYKLNGEAVQRSKLRADTRKWIVSKLIPKYQDKQQVSLGADATLSDLMQQINGTHIKPKKDS